MNTRSIKNKQLKSEIESYSIAIEGGAKCLKQTELPKRSATLKKKSQSLTRGIMVTCTK